MHDTEICRVALLAFELLSLLVVVVLDVLFGRLHACIVLFDGRISSLLCARMCWVWAFLANLAGKHCSGHRRGRRAGVKKAGK